MNDLPLPQPPLDAAGPHMLEPLARVERMLTEDDRRMLEIDDWYQSDVATRQHYGGQAVAATRGKIWGVGPDYADALAAALATPGCPPRSDLVLVLVPELSAEESPEYTWCLTDPAVQQECGGLIAALHGRQIWGKGLQAAEAWEDARRKSGCPARQELVFLIVPWMGRGDGLS